MREWARKNVVAIAGPPVIMMLWALFLFQEVLFTGRCLSGSDFVLQFYPWKKFVFDHLQSQGSLPFWNPYLFSGSPLIPNIQVSLFYPLGFLVLSHASGRGSMGTAPCSILCLDWVSCISSCAAWMRHRAACLFSAIVFMFNGYFEHLNTSVYAGLPVFRSRTISGFP